MDRKHFFSSILGVSMSLPVLADSISSRNNENANTIPPALQPGDTVGITAPAGYITEKEILPAVQQLQNWGFRVRAGTTIGKRDFTFGGTDEERIKDFQQMLDDPSIKAILCARGGYGAIRIIDQLRWDSFISHPKWIIGFSDITVIHSHLSRNYGVASIHSKMCNSFPENWSQLEPGQADSISSIRDALKGIKIKYPVVPNPKNRKGTGEGLLVGGNLKTLETLSASHSDIQTNGRILFVEDTGEYLYSIDRMFWNLKRTGKLDQLAGLVVGGFRLKPDDPGEEFGKDLYDIVLEKVSGYSYPVCFDFPVGHQKVNYALKCMVNHRFEVSGDLVSLKEI